MRTLLMGLAGGLIRLNNAVGDCFGVQFVKLHQVNKFLELRQHFFINGLLIFLP